jgi:hypothetical protein
MVQRFSAFGLSGSGIVAVLFISGVILHIFEINEIIGNVAIIFSVMLGLVMGFLGVIGIIKRL